MKNSTSASKGLIIAFLVISVVTVCFAANYTTGSAGNWATSSIWGGTVPSQWGNHTVNINHNVTLTNTTTALNGFTAINLNGGRSFTSGLTTTANNLSLQSTNFTIVNGVMTVYGNLTLNSNSSLVLTSGSLVVTGKLTVNGGSLTVANNQNVTVGQLEVTNSGGSLTNNGNITVNGNLTQNGPITNNATGKVQVNGNHIFGGSWNSTFTNNGTYNLTGSMTVPSSSIFQTRPGGKTNVNGSVNVDANQNLVIGTSTNPPPYAEMVIKQNLASTGSGDILIDRNGRLAVFGNLTANGGGSFLTINNGGQVYVDGNISMNGGGNHINNNNTSSPWGLYTDGTVTYTGGGSGTNGHAQGSIQDMYNESRPFFDWVAGIPGSPLPIELVYFKVSSVSAGKIDLSWLTSFEKDFSHFQVERASSDLNFSLLTEIAGKGGMDINASYTYSDLYPLNGKNYYRLKCIDVDGHFEYSPVIVADHRATERLSVYPNPVLNRSFNVKVGGEVSPEAHVELLDVTGNVLIVKPASSSALNINLPENTKPGFYYVRITGEHPETVKVIVK